MHPLLIMYLLLIPSAALFIYSKYRGKSLLAAIFKGIATWIIIGGALAGILAGDGIAGPFALLIIGGLAMGLAGDVALALPRPGLESGMVFFGLGHCCYIAALLHLSSRAGWAILFFILIFALLIYLYRKGNMDFGGLLIPIIIYSLIVTVMLSLAATMPISSFPSGLILLVAAALFALSDAMLAKNGLDARKALDTISFKLTPLERGVVSLCCYFIGQSLFAVSVYLF